jgi:hypothetical protein
MSAPFSRFLSIFLHPVFMPMYTLYIIFHSESYLSNNIPAPAKNFLYLFVFILTVLMPVLSSYILVRNKMVSSMHMPFRSDRYAPFMITIFYYCLLYYMLRRIPNLPPSLLSVLLGSIMTLLCIVIINNKIKVSAHTAGIAGVFGVYLGLSSIWIIEADMSLLLGLILTVGALASARLRLGTHTPLEVYLGVIIGFTMEFIAIRYHLYV